MKVIYIDNGHCKKSKIDSLVIGNSYELISYEGNGFCIISNGFRKMRISTKLLKTPSEIRSDKIKNLFKII